MSKGYSDYLPETPRSSLNPSGRPALYASAHNVSMGEGFSAKTHADMIAIFREILSRKIHGLSFSPYIEGQSPGFEIEEEQIQARLDIIKPFTNWIRTFSCTEGNQQTPRIAHEKGLKTMVGVSLGPDKDRNELELINGIEIARSGYADILAIGNEVLLRGDLSEETMLGYLRRAKDAVPGVPVSYVDAYFLFENHRRITEACDVILINCYPFWECCAAEYSLLYMKEMYRRAQRVANGKKIIISETGWPNTGTPYGAAVPSPANALGYFINTYQWADEEDIEIFYFSSFDESWKVGDEGDVGAYWGIWDKDGNLKYV